LKKLSDVMEMRFVLLIALLLTLPASVSAQARVVVDVRGHFGESLPGAHVTVLHENGGGLAGECWTVGSTGCAVTVVPRRRYIVRASVPGHVPQQGVVGTVAGDNSVRLDVFPIARLPIPEPDSTNTSIASGMISGFVRSLHDEPVAGVYVLALVDGQYHGAGSSTAQDGSFRFSVPPGTYTVRSQSAVNRRTQEFIEGAAYGVPLTVASGHVTGPVTLYPGSFNLPDVNVTVLTPGGKPVAGADVIDSSRWRSSAGVEHSVNGRRESGRNGVVVIPAALPTTLTITATATVGGDHLAGMMAVKVGRESLDVVMTLGPAAQVSGRVEFTGRPRPLHSGDGLQVLSDPGPARSGYSPADANGRVGADGEFVLKGLAGERCLVLRNVPGGWRLAEITHYGRPLEGKPLLFQPGEKVEGVVFRVEPTTLSSSHFPPDPPCPVTRPDR
jgi:hypothetical protein